MHRNVVRFAHGQHVISHLARIAEGLLHSIPPTVPTLGASVAVAAFAYSMYISGQLSALTDEAAVELLAHIDILRNGSKAVLATDQRAAVWQGNDPAIAALKARGANPELVAQTTTILGEVLKLDKLWADCTSDECTWLSPAAKLHIRNVRGRILVNKRMKAIFLVYLMGAEQWALKNAQQLFSAEHDQGSLARRWETER